jgi:hypothetical protein
VEGTICNLLGRLLLQHRLNEYEVAEDIQYIAASDLEQMQHKDKDKDDRDYGVAVRVQKFLEQFPGRRMFDYKDMSDKYGFLFDSADDAFEKFETGSDHMS